MGNNEGRVMDKARIKRRLEMDLEELHYARDNSGEIEIAAWQDRVDALQYMLDPQNDAERCALLCECLADIHRKKAVKIRKAGEFTVRTLWPWGTKTVVKPGAERTASYYDACINTLTTMTRMIRKGYDPRTLPDYVPPGGACYCDLNEADCKAAGHPVSEQLRTTFHPCRACTDPLDCGSRSSCRHGGDEH